MFSGVTHEAGIKVRHDTQVIKKKGSFNYLEFIIQSKGEIEDDLTHHISAGWMTWRQASGLLYDKKVPPKLKGNF
ncbi:hypothetical protein H5410_033062 [Solanum commersonii]|uniref:Uncharacterized protein n=1 Tax=Solanum commersonii TaxID=4109 RepID=A0A9J5YRH1_SOLCO|nr:hypothetical protein H5410_033062 [Solanum commersonii]